MLVLVWVSLAAPSLFIVQKLAGTAGVLAYLPVSLGIVLAISRLPLPRRSRDLTVLAAITVALLVILFIVIYPRVNTHVPGLGSDDDDAYNVGAQALLAAHSPYEFRTYLGNVLHQFAGAFVVAIPFVVLGTSAWQNLFWLPLFFVVIQRATGSSDRALRSAWTMLLGAPVVLHQIVTGTGHLSNAVYVLLALWWLTRSERALLPSIAWGCVLASRANFFFLVPLAFGFLARQRGVIAAAQSTVLSLITSALLIVPFYLHDPAHFGPLDAADRLRRIDVWVPHGGDLVAAAMGLLAMVLACRPTDLRRLFLHCALVQAVPIVIVPGIEYLARGGLDLSYLTYGVFVLPFVVAASAIGGSTAAQWVGGFFVSKGSQAAMYG